jgi:hypothetical protein
MSALLQSVSVTGPEQHGQKTTPVTRLREAPGASRVRNGAAHPRDGTL